MLGFNESSGRNDSVLQIKTFTSSPVSIKWRGDPEAGPYHIPVLLLAPLEPTAGCPGTGMPLSSLTLILSSPCRPFPASPGGSRTSHRVLEAPNPTLAERTVPVDAETCSEFIQAGVTHGPWEQPMRAASAIPAKPGNAPTMYLTLQEPREEALF